MINQPQVKMTLTYQYQMSKQQQEYQIQPFQIQQKCLTHQQLNKMIQNWDTFQRIQQKFNIWQFSFQYQKIPNIAPQSFYKSAIHYVFLKKLHLLIKDYDPNQLLRNSLQLKQIYKVQSISGKIKGRRFDYLLLVTVKLIGFFLGSHTRQIIIDTQLQAQIYAILVYVLLGTQVGEKAYSVMIDKYKIKQPLKYSVKATVRSQFKKSSMVPTQLSKKNSQHKQKIKSTAISKKRIGRTQCRTGTALFHKLPQSNQNQSYIEMKQQLKSNLLVKQFIPKPKQKQSLNLVLNKILKTQKKIEQLREIKQKQKILSSKIQYTQMSSSLDLRRNNQSLNMLYNHSINIKPQKKSKYYQLVKKDDIKKLSLKQQKTNIQNTKLPKIQTPFVNQVYSYQAMVQKKKQSSYWKNIISSMKQNQFHSIQHFPPISAKMYFKQGQLDEENKKIRYSQTLQLLRKQNQHIQNNNKKITINQNKENDKQKQQDNAQYITQKVIQLPKTLKTLKNFKQIHNLPTLSKLSSHNSQQQTKLNKRTSIRQPSPVITKDQINIIQYSIISNSQQIYKQTKGFTNIYSNKPIQQTKIKKKSYVELKQIQKQFLKQCSKRNQQINHSYFC